MSTPAPERDPWLAAALRHAPDADASAPAALSAAILRAARDAAAPPQRHASLAARVAAAWSWLARPPVAAAFASLVVATTVGVLWWGEPVDPRVAPQPRPSPAATPPAAPPVDAVPQSVETPPPTAPAEAVSGARQVAPALRSRPTPAASAEPKAAPALAAPAPAAPMLAESRGDAERAGDAGLAAGSTAADTGLRAKAAAPRAEAAGAQPARIAAPIPTPAVVFDAIRADPAGWQWQHGSEPPRAADAQFVAWLDALASARWERAVDASAPVPSLTLLRDGRAQATLDFDSTPLRYAAGGIVWQAVLEPDRVAQLRAALQRLAR